MRVLYVVGSCLSKNTSANMSHNGYVQGLLENGCDVDILMAKNSWGAQDNGMPVWDKAQYYSYASVSLKDRIRLKVRGKTPQNSTAATDDNVALSKPKLSQRLKGGVRRFVKTTFYKLFPNDPLYPLEKTWLKKAAKYRSEREYDLVISNSSPAASHKLVCMLLQNKRISCKRWVQIWEDPWFYDLYGGTSEAICAEEHSLLRQANEIYYVSPLTLKYQQEYFKDCADKMKHIPLPYLDFSTEHGRQEREWSFGYFGDYYSHTRNLMPFYEALCASGLAGNIYGDSNLSLKSTNKISVSGRVTLDVLAQVQDKTKVLVHLSNLRGGQIPGKIYHYSATNKPILFILDGTAEEQELLKKYFSQFDRFYFCENNEEAIAATMKKICEENRTYAPLPDFAPKQVIEPLLNR